MTIGIYKLTFKGLEDWPYVGQSQNIEERFIAHKSSIKLGKSNYKMLEAYEISGELPEFSILEICAIDSLDEKEIFWIKTLDSINNGLNLTDKVINKAYGQENFNSRFTDCDIESGFLFICDNLHLSNKQLANTTGLSEAVVCGILHGSLHVWLKDKYFDKYSELVNRSIKRTNSAKKLGVTYPKILSPQGNVYEVENLSEFAREHNLNKSSLHQVLTGKRKTCSRWKLA